MYTATTACATVSEFGACTRNFRIPMNGVRDVLPCSTIELEVLGTRPPVWLGGRQNGLKPRLVFPMHETTTTTIIYLWALGLVILTVNGISCRHHATSSVETGMDARLSDGYSLLLHHLTNMGCTKSKTSRWYAPSAVWYLQRARKT